MENILREISGCQLCAEYLTPRPVLTAHPNAKILIVGQAPGIKVHQSGIPWDDKSGENLRQWMGVSEEQFYDPKLVALLPMGFCYPGKGKSGDLPPRPECAPSWHEKVLSKMNEISLTLLVGKYAQDYYLESPKSTLTETVRSFQDYLPHHLVLPHPSPRNNIWRAKNKWFDLEVVPELQTLIKKILP